MNEKLGARLLLVLSAILLVAACGGSAATAGRTGPGGPAAPGNGSGSGSSGYLVPKTATAGAPVSTDVAQPVTPPDSVVPPIADGPRVIRTARVSIEVRNGSFDSTLDRLFAVSTDLGGYVSGSDASAATGELRNGTITFLVPVDKFTEAVSRVRALGTVQNLVIGGQDVSAQYVDLQARLKNQEAQRDAMLALLQQAKSISDIIAIQAQLGSITAQIEQLKGQIDYLDHATSYSTISVSVHEAALALKPQTDPWGILAALSQGFHGFVGTLDYLLVGVGYAGPFLLLLLGGFVAWRLRRRFAL